MARASSSWPHEGVSSLSIWLVPQARGRMRAYRACLYGSCLKLVAAWGRIEPIYMALPSGSWLMAFRACQYGSCLWLVAEGVTSLSIWLFPQARGWGRIEPVYMALPSGSWLRAYRACLYGSFLRLVAERVWPGDGAMLGGRLHRGRL